MSWRAMAYGLLLAIIAVVLTFSTGYSPEAALIGGFGLGIFVTAWAFETSTEPRKGAVIAETSDTDPRAAKMEDDSHG